MKTNILILLAISTFTLTANAGEIVQAFINQSFGGNPNNGPVLMNEANAINKYKAPVVTSSNNSSSSSSSSANGSSGNGSSSTGGSSVSQFSATVDNLVQSAIANRLVTQALGTSNSTPLPANTIDTGVNTITITSIATGTQVTIVNDLTGARSIVTVPIY